MAFIEGAGALVVLDDEGSAAIYIVKQTAVLFAISVRTS